MAQTQGELDVIAELRNLTFNRAWSMVTVAEIEAVAELLEPMEWSNLVFLLGTALGELRRIKRDEFEPVATITRWTHKKGPRRREP